jgi:trimeric autotransporter adhesin
MNPLIRSRKTTPIFLVTSLCFGFLPVAQAQLPLPTPDGFYPGGNTAEGRNALKNVNVTTGAENTAIGYEALLNDMSGGFNTATGSGALHENTTGNSNTAYGRFALHDNNGDANTAVGRGALKTNTIGGDNTATGYHALFSNRDGNNNTATGVNALEMNNEGNNTADGALALQFNVIGNNNTANGAFALASNINGKNNTAIGENALAFNIGCCGPTFENTGSENTAVGVEALFSNQNGAGNTATGFQAMSNNTTGLFNAAYGWGALHNNNGSENTALGFAALASNTGGNANTAVGKNTMFASSGSANTAVGDSALFANTGNGNTALGFFAGADHSMGNNNIYIDNRGVGVESGTIRIGKGGTHTATFVAGIANNGVFGGLEVVIDQNGKLGVLVSSARFKEDIKPMGDRSEAILALHPVSFRYKREIEPTRPPGFGLIAEDVEKINPDLVVRDEEGKPYSVRYDAVNAMLLNEFLKEHQKVQRLEAALAAMDQRLKAQDAKIQRVNDKVELNKPAPQTALSNR